MGGTVKNWAQGEGESSEEPMPGELTELLEATQFKKIVFAFEADTQDG